MDYNTLETKHKYLRLYRQRYVTHCSGKKKVTFWMSIHREMIKLQYTEIFNFFFENKS